MEPFSVAVSVLTTVQAALTLSVGLAKHIRDSRQASKEKKLLAEEASSLAKLLARLSDRAQTSQSETWLADHSEIVRQFEAAFEDLATALKVDTVTGETHERGRLNAIRAVAGWSFSKSEVYSLLHRVERLQRHAAALLADEQYAMLERLDQKHQEAIDQQTKTSIVNWLTPLQMSQIHQTISDQAEKGSGQWFLELNAFLKWQEGKNNLLWCWGIPGAGKTVIASIVVNHLRQSRGHDQKDKIGIAAIYLKYNNSDQTIDNVLGSLLRQLVQEFEPLPCELVGLYEQHRGRNTMPSLAEITEVLKSTFDNFDEVFLVLDGLDECNEGLRWDLIDQLEKFGSKLRLLVTSRYLNAIDEELANFDRFEIKANRADIELFIDYQIKKNRNLRRLVLKSPNLRADIKDAVVKTAEHMFLLARLHVESLATAAGLSVRYVRQKLQSLPNTLTATYDSAMQRIAEQEPDHKKIAFKALAWVTYAFQTLSLKQLQHALAIEPGDSELDEELIIEGHSITALCAGLLIIEKRTNMVNLVHYTTKSYFDERRQSLFPDFHASITLSCATYLTLRSLQNFPIRYIVQQYPLACYAAQYLGDHARQTPEEALALPTLEAICQLLSDPNRRKPLLSLLDGLDLIRSGFYSSNKLTNDNYALEEKSISIPTDNFGLTCTSDAFDMDDTSIGPRTYSISSISLGDFGTDTSTLSGDDGSQLSFLEGQPWKTEIGHSRIPEVTALHLAASMGLAKVGSMLLKETPNVDAVDETGKTALTVAMERGFEKAVEFLLTSGACVDLHTEHGRSVLLLIAERNWKKAGNIIINKTRSQLKDEECMIMENQIRLILAAYDGDVNEVRRMSSQDVYDLQGRDRTTGEMALFLAIEQGRQDMVDILLDIGVNINSKDTAGRTALFRASRRLHEETVKLLLSKGADVDTQDDEGRTAWSANVRSRNKRILGLLLAAGADPSTRGLQGVSELYTAAKDGDTELVKFMLDSGTNPSVQTVYHWAPLHWAASYGHIECAKLLVQAGADVCVLSDQGVTPLDLALQSGQVAICDILKRAGAKTAKEVANSKELKSAERSVDDRSSSDRDWILIGERLNSLMPLQNSEPPDFKLFLVFDKPLSQCLIDNRYFGQFAYPRQQSNVPVPNGYIYQVSQLMETTGSTISVRLAKRRAEMSEYPLLRDDFNFDDVLYDLHRLRPDYQEFELRGRHQNPLHSSLRMFKDWTGSWKIHVKEDSDGKDFLFRTTPDWSPMSEEECRWITEDGSLLARSGWDDETPNICLELGLSRRMIDLIVSCWIGKLWAESAAKSPHEL
ncbi:hypothetical protein PRK78_001786 [Emydomyces testavorans]|uniref:NACHT domain-containing protein n=1 Tax=Emydomyces testavorans TaxID=2070801 RepID=A0AAF0DDI8_9EURO|nr:hypothetical protein PRK78_001786 [Emydomyces testavorans]